MTTTPASVVRFIRRTAFLSDTASSGSTRRMSRMYPADRAALAAPARMRWGAQSSRSKTKAPIRCDFFVASAWATSLTW